MGFNVKTKLAAAVYQDTETQGMHADHIKPRSKGGTDDAGNCQLISATDNMRKGDKTVQLRRWQIEFLQDWDKTDQKRFLLVATPGGGKTVAALTAANRFLSVGNDRRLIVVVPTINLREQWRKEATAFGMDLQTKEFGANFKSGFIGGVITYQSLDSYCSVLRLICSRSPTMLIMDEPHHCGDKASWGHSVRTAFETADRRLLLSGTPFRTDGQSIPFIDYDGNGVCLPSFRYDYPGALLDGVVRFLAFDYGKGSFEMLESWGREHYDMNTSISEEEAEKRLRHILNPGGNFVRSQIQQANDKLQELRQSVPDAAAMAVCIDQSHAARVAEVIESVSGSVPSLIVSDEEMATDTVSAFRKGKSPWVVSVRQISEGTDIKRLQVLCYLTTATTEIFFRQLIGRVSRVRYKEADAPTPEALDADREAYVFLPADPRLLTHAKNIEEAQMRAIKQEAEREEEKIERDLLDGDPPPLFLGSDHLGTDTIVIRSTTYSAEQAQQIGEISVEIGVTMEKAAIIFDKYVVQRNEARTQRAPESQTLDKEEVLKVARARCNSLAFRLSRLVGCHVREIHSKFRRQEDMGLEEVASKTKTITRWISNGAIE